MKVVKFDKNRKTSRNASETTWFELTAIYPPKMLDAHEAFDSTHQHSKEPYPVSERETKDMRCHGLSHLQHLLKTTKSDVAFALGNCAQDACYQAPSDTEAVTLRSVLDRLIGCESTIYKFKENQSALICFDVVSGGRSPQKTWDMLTEIDDELLNVGYQSCTP